MDDLSWWDMAKIRFYGDLFLFVYVSLPLIVIALGAYFAAYLLNWTGERDRDRKYWKQRARKHRKKRERKQ